MLHLDPYDKKVVEALQKMFRYSEDEAQRIFQNYQEPLQMLDGYDSPEERAFQLHTIVGKGMSPEDWVKHINKARILRNKTIHGHGKNLSVVNDKNDEITIALEDVEQSLIAVQQLLRRSAKARAFRQARYAKGQVHAPGSGWVLFGDQGEVTGSGNLDLVKKIAAKPFVLKRRTEVKNSEGSLIESALSL